MMSRAGLLRWLRVPHVPAAPVGDEQVMTFRAAPNYFRYTLALWALKQAGALFAVLLYFGFLPIDPPPFARIPDVDMPTVTIGPIVMTRGLAEALVFVVEMIGLGVYAVQAVFSALIQRLDFEQRWYLVSDRSVRIREGLVVMEEKTMTFANVQHVGIRQNPIQRWLGIADVEVRTAGGGGGRRGEHDEKSDSHVGYLRGVDNAEAVRDVIQARLRRKQQPAPPVEQIPPARPPALLEAAAALRDEARALRQALSPPPVAASPEI